MDFSHKNSLSGDKVTKIAVVTALHLAVAVSLINMKMPVSSTPPDKTDITFVEPVVPPKVEEPPPTLVEHAPPPVPILTVPLVEVPIQDPKPQILETVKAERFPPALPHEPQVQVAKLTEVRPAAPVHTDAHVDAAGCEKPAYPARAARNGDTGTVSLALLVGTDGRVAGSRIQKSSGSRELDVAAVNALSMCKFKPATTNGVPEQAWAQLAYVWTLDQ